MEGELWSEVYRILQEEGNKHPRPKKVQFDDFRILEVYFWAVIHDRPTRWACRKENWPQRQQRRPYPATQQ
jgi:hypothetical protein